MHVERDVLHEELPLVGEGEQLEAVEARGEPPEPLGDAQHDLPEVLLAQLILWVAWQINKNILSRKVLWIQGAASRLGPWLG